MHQCLDIFQMQPSLHKTKGLSLWSEYLLEFNLPFLPQYLNLDLCLLNYSMLQPISQVSPQRQYPESEHPTYECDNHIFLAQYPYPVGPGALHMVWLWGWSVLFGNSRDNTTYNSKCVFLDTILTWINAKQDWGSELKLQERRRLSEQKDCFLFIKKA